jgi:hypothetical protein
MTHHHVLKWKLLFVAILGLVMAACAAVPQPRSFTDQVTIARALLTGVDKSIGDLTEAGVLHSSKAQEMLDQAKQTRADIAQAETLYRTGKQVDAQNLLATTQTVLLALREQLIKMEKQP